MGTDESEQDLKARSPGSSISTFLLHERPAHKVRLSAFSLTRREITVGEYRACVSAGACTATPALPRCNAEHPAREEHPVNCVTWWQARSFCEWVGGRLPSEAEWEFAARSAGQSVLFPWGDDAPTCDLAHIDGPADQCVPPNRTAPVCSKPKGNTAQGLCDMAGNVWEWVEDWFADNYEGASPQGVPFRYALREPPMKVLRGGGIQSTGDYRATHRVYHPPEWEYRGVGIRCARDSETPEKTTG